MRKPLGKLGGAIVGPLLRAATLLLLFSSALCHAQCATYLTNISSITPSTLMPGKTTNITVLGQYLASWYPAAGVANGMDCEPLGPDFEIQGGEGGVWPMKTISAPPTSMGLWLLSLVDGSQVSSEFGTVAIDSWTDSEITASVTPGANDPAQTACVFTIGDDMADNGYWGPWGTLTASSCRNAGGFPIQIGCTAPTITSVNPLGWWAGQNNQTITINGGCFLTPSDSSGPSKVTATANGVTLSNISVVSSNQITATVNVTKEAPAETVTLTVTNPSTSGGPTKSATASPAPVVLPIPIISWRNRTISGDGAQKQSVKVGQPVELKTTPETLPGGFTVSTSTWDIDGRTIKSYDGSSAGITLQETDLDTKNTTFYWLYPDDPLQVIYDYCATGSDGTQYCTSPKAKAAFRATRPNINLAVTNPYNRGRVNELPVCGQRQRMAHLFYGDLHYQAGCTPPYRGPVGIELTPSGGESGIYKFVQVLPPPGDTLSWDGPRPFQCGPYVNALDHSYPFPGVRPIPPAAPTMAYDGPGQSLPNIYSSGTRDFHATMYLLWQPPQLTGTGAASIPVPIGYQQWQFGATADQEAPIGRGKWQQPVTNAAGAVGRFIPSTEDDNAKYGYPVWGDVSGIESCDPISQTEEIDE